MGDNDIPVATPIPEQPAVANATEAVGAISDAEALDALKVLEERRKQRRKNKIIKAVIAVAVLAAIGAGVFFFTQNKPAESEDTGPVVETDVVVREDYSVPISGNGSLQAKATTAVSPEVEGTVTEIYAKEGDQVEKGAQLFSIESEEIEQGIEDAADKVQEAESAISDAQSLVSEARSVLKEANSTYKSVKARYDKAKKKYDAQKKKQEAAQEKAEKKGDAAYKRIYENKISKIPSDATKQEKEALKKEAVEEAEKARERAKSKVKIPKVDDFDKEGLKEELADAKADVDAASADVSAAEGDVRAAKSDLQSAEADYAKAVAERDKCLITAPQAGTLVSFKLEVGDTIGGTEGDESETSVRISDLSALRMSIEVNESDISKIEVGQGATVVPQAFSDVTLNATVTEIAESASGMDEGGYDGGSVTFTVKLLIDEPDERLKPGMTASVKILTQEIKDALIVPTNALIEEDDGTYVDVVVDEETYETEHKKVTVQTQDNTRAVIKKGLKEGDVVVVSSIDFTEEDGDFEDADADMEDEDFEEDYGDDYEDDFEDDFEDVGMDEDLDYEE